MEHQAAIYFRDQFRTARAIALNDAEAFQEILFVVERLGYVLTNSTKARGLGDYKQCINHIANTSPLAEEIPTRLSHWHMRFGELFEIVRNARNDALHQGAFARHLTTHAMQLALVLEDALMINSAKVGDYMVREPVAAAPWQPISFIRQQMLANSFSYLPVWLTKPEAAWYLLSDYNIAHYLRSNQRERKVRLLQTLESALTENQMQLEKAVSCSPDTSIDEALQLAPERPLLIIHPENPQWLLGIVTPFDLL